MVRENVAASVFSLTRPRRGRNDFGLKARNVTLFTIVSSAMPYSNSAAKDSQKVGACDEAELARMGYKQELKCVQFNSCAHYLRNL
jgi:hypothetical protein